MTLALVSIILAGKLSQQKQVCYPKMMALINKAKGLQHITRQNLIEFEVKVLNILEWDLNCVSPISFLERYQRIFDLDKENDNQYSKLIGVLSRRILRHIVLNASFLKYRPSQIAAASIMLAINMSQSDFAVKIPVTKLAKLKKEGWVFAIPLNDQE